MRVQAKKSCEITIYRLLLSKTAQSLWQITSKRHICSNQLTVEAFYRRPSQPAQRNINIFHHCKIPPPHPLHPLHVASICGGLITNCPHHIPGSYVVLPAGISKGWNQIRKCIKPVKNMFSFKTSVCYLTLSKRGVPLQTQPQSNPLMIKLVLIHLIQNKDINSILSNPLHRKLSARQKRTIVRFWLNWFSALLAQVKELLIRAVLLET